MSIENVQAFIDASKRPENKDAYEAQLKSFGEIDGEEAVVKLANQLGFEFDLSDLETFMKAQADDVASRLDNGELNEDELAAVAGGGAPTFCSAWYYWPCNGF